MGRSLLLGVRRDRVRIVRKLLWTLRGNRKVLLLLLQHRETGRVGIHDSWGWECGWTAGAVCRIKKRMTGNDKINKMKNTKSKIIQIEKKKKDIIKENIIERY